MRRLLIGIVAAGIVLATGASYAQESGPAMPAKVRAFLNRLTGSWDCGGSFEGTCEVHWDAAGAVLIDSGQFKEDDVSGTWSGVWYWDGVSDDGVIVSWGSPGDRGFSHGRLDGKVLSPTVMEARRTGVRLGKPITANIRIEFESANRYTWAGTDEIVGGEKQPDYTDIYTRAQPTSDEEELVKVDTAWGDYLLAGDVEGLDRILAEEYTCTGSSGDSWTKEQELADLRSGDLKLTSAVGEDLKVRVYGDMGVNTGIFVEKGQYKGRDISGKYAFTDTWIKRDGRWQCVASHISKVTKAPTSRSKAFGRYRNRRLTAAPRTSPVRVA